MVYQLQVITPPSQGQPDVNIPLSTSVQSDEDALMLLVQYINEYLRYVVAFIGFLMVIYAGYILITANGEDKWSDVGRIFINLFIGILIVIFSALAVSLLVNLL